MAEAAAVRARAAVAVTTAVDTMSAIAARHGHCLRAPRVLPDADTGIEVSLVFTAAGVGDVRRLVGRIVGAASVVEDARQDFVLAVYELVTNAVRHGGGWGRIRLRREEHLLICVVTDRGPGFTGDATRLGTPPPLESTGGRGLLLARRLTHSLDISTGPGGVTITATMSIDGGRGEGDRLGAAVVGVEVELLGHGGRQRDGR